MKKKITIAAVLLVIIAVIVAVGSYIIHSDTHTSKITKEFAQEFVNSEFDKMAEKNPVLKEIADKNYITVNDLSYGSQKDIILDCDVLTYDIYGIINPYYDDFLSVSVKKKNGTMFKSALDFKLEFQPKIQELIASAEAINVSCDIVLYETKEGLQVYAEDSVVDCVYGRAISITKDISEKSSYVDSEGEHQLESGNINKGFNQCFDLVYNSEKPETAGIIGKIWNSIKKDFNRNFIEHGRWKTIFAGLWTTLKLTFCAVLIGIVLGFLEAFVRCTYLKLSKHGPILKFFNAICQIYLTVTRGTPAVVQIMIIYFVIFMPLGVDKFIAAVICFGLNSGAYVAEIVRGGIMSVDNGQTEAGRSLGFNYMQTMYNIVFPQAFKNVLPALANEFVVLLKETSIAFYIGLGDLMYAGNAIRAATYSPFMPLVAVAIIYLVMVLILSKLVSILERRLRRSDR